MTEPVTATEQRALPSLTSLRWYAALLVFAYHLDQNGFAWRPANVFVFGYTGVAFFFVLSGFVLAYSSGRTVSRGRFYYRRFARIYPLHIATFALVGLIAIAQPGLHVLGATSALLHLTLTQAWWPGYRMTLTWNGPSWSLSCEAFFYACFPILIGWMRRVPLRRATACVAIGLVLAMTATLLLRRAGTVGNGTADFDPALRFPEFALGVLLAVALRTGALRIRLPLWAPVLLTAALGVLSWRGVLAYFPFADYLLLPGFALLIVTAASCDRRGTSGVLERVLRHRVSVYLGELSFAFYLVHDELVLSGLDQAFGWRHAWSPAAGTGPVVVLLAATVAAAALLHHLVEKPARRALLGLLDRRTRPVATPASESG